MYVSRTAFVHHPESFVCEPHQLVSFVYEPHQLVYVSRKSFVDYIHCNVYHVTRLTYSNVLI